MSTGPLELALSIASSIGSKPHDEIASELSKHGKQLFCDFYDVRELPAAHRADMLKRAAVLETIVMALPKDQNKTYCYGLERIGEAVWGDSFRNAPEKWRDSDWVPGDDEYQQLRFGLGLIGRAGSVHRLQYIKGYNFEWFCEVLTNFAHKKGISNLIVTVGLSQQAFLLATPISPFQRVLAVPATIFSVDVVGKLPDALRQQQLQSVVNEVALRRDETTQAALARVVQESVSAKYGAGDGTPEEAIGRVFSGGIRAWSQQYLQPPDARWILHWSPHQFMRAR